MGPGLSIIRDFVAAVMKRRRAAVGPIREFTFAATRVQGFNAPPINHLHSRNVGSSDLFHRSKIFARNCGFREGFNAIWFIELSKTSWSSQYHRLPSAASETTPSAPSATATQSL